MSALGRAVGLFCFCMIAGYMLMVVVLPRPSPAAPAAAPPGGQVAAARLSHEAHFLMGQRNAGQAR